MKLTPKQKAKLPKAMQKAILRKKAPKKKAKTK